jgi:hypothetical protein
MSLASLLKSKVSAFANSIEQCQLVETESGQPLLEV